MSCRAGRNLQERFLLMRIPFLHRESRPDRDAWIHREFSDMRYQLAALERENAAFTKLLSEWAYDLNEHNHFVPFQGSASETARMGHNNPRLHL